MFLKCVYNGFVSAPGINNEVVYVMDANHHVDDDNDTTKKIDYGHWLSAKTSPIAAGLVL